jgi:hypothetical protein
MTSAATFLPAKLTPPASIDFQVEVNEIAADSTVPQSAASANGVATFVILFI